MRALEYTGCPWRRYIYSEPLHKILPDKFVQAIETCLSLPKRGHQKLASRLLRSMHYLNGDEYSYIISCVYALLFRMKVTGDARPEWLTLGLLDKWIEQLEKEIKSEKKKNKLIINDIRGFAAGINSAKIHTDTDFETWADKLAEITVGYKASTLLRHIKNSNKQW